MLREYECTYAEVVAELGKSIPRIHGPTTSTNLFVSTFWTSKKNEEPQLRLKRHISWAHVCDITHAVLGLLGSHYEHKLLALKKVSAQNAFIGRRIVALVKRPNEIPGIAKHSTWITSLSTALVTEKIDHFIIIFDVHWRVHAVDLIYHRCRLASFVLSHPCQKLPQKLRFLPTNISKFSVRSKTYSYDKSAHLFFSTETLK